MRSPNAFCESRPTVAAAGLAFALLVAASDLRAQAVNVDFGDPESAPAATYGGAGLPGAWNAIGVLPPGERAALVGLDGQPVAARLYGIGGTAMLAHDDPATAGDDAALLDDMLIGYNDPLDVCIWIEALVEGDYEVITYALTPGTASLLSRVRVDDATPGPIMVGGEWTGVHTEGVTYARHLVHTLNGKIGFHSGLYGGLIQSGMNGIQIRPVSPVGVGDAGENARSAGFPGGIRSAQPNPARGAQRLEVVVPAGLAGAVPWLEVLDSRGRAVFRRALPIEARNAGDPGAARDEWAQWVEWDGRDASGRAVPAGLYFARIVPGGGAPGTTRSTKLVRIP